MPESEKTFNQGSCRAAIFANEIKQNGKIAIVKKVAIQRRYRDKSGNWQNTNSFGVNDLPKLALVATKAYDYLTSKKEEQDWVDNWRYVKVAHNSIFKEIWLCRHQGSRIARHRLAQTTIGSERG